MTRTGLCQELRHSAPWLNISVSSRPWTPVSLSSRPVSVSSRPRGRLCYNFRFFFTVGHCAVCARPGGLSDRNGGRWRGTFLFGPHRLTALWRKYFNALDAHMRALELMKACRVIPWMGAPSLRWASEAARTVKYAWRKNKTVIPWSLVEVCQHLQTKSTADLTPVVTCNG